MFQSLLRVGVSLCFGLGVRLRGSRSLDIRFLLGFLRGSGSLGIRALLSFSLGAPGLRFPLRLVCRFGSRRRVGVRQRLGSRLGFRHLLRLGVSGGGGFSRLGFRQRRRFLGLGGVRGGSLGGGASTRFLRRAFRLLRLHSVLGGDDTRSLHPFLLRGRLKGEPASVLRDTLALIGIVSP